MSIPIRVLVVEDRATDAELIIRQLRRDGFDPEWTRVETEQAYIERLRDGFDLVLSDYQLPDFDGMRALELMNQSGLQVPFILVSGTIGESTAVEAMKRGAADYLLKEQLFRLGNAVTHALAEARMRREQLQADEAARLATAKLRQLLDHSPAVLYALSIEGERTIPSMVSENISRLLGYDVADAMSHDWWLRQLHPDDRDRAAASIPETIAHGMSHTEYRLRHRNGDYHWLEDNRQLVRNASGTPTGFVGVWSDITVRKRAQETLAEITLREARRHKVEARLDMGILLAAAAFVFGFAYRFNLFVPPLRWILKHSDTIVDETTGTLVFLCFGLSLYAYRALQRTKLRLNAHQQAEQALKLLQDELDQRIQQRTVDLSRTNQILQSEINERRRSESSLLESEERFRQLAETVTQVFWMLDPLTGKILYISPAYEKIWGRSREGLIMNTLDWLDPIRAEDRARVKAVVIDTPITQAFECTYRISRPDGAVRWIHDRGFPVRNAAGEVYRVVGIADDITDQRSVEEQLRQAQKMEAIGTLAGGIAHDFNNILAGIRGYVELSRMILDGNPEVQDHLGLVLQATGRAGDLVRQILTFTRQQQQERRPIHLEPVLAETLKLLRATIPSTIEFDTLLATDAPTVLADATQVHQIMMNLGTNAWHAMKDQKGRLSVRLERCVVDQAQAEAPSHLRAGLYCRVSVGDSGCGMDPATLGRIFEPFFTTKPPGEGTGLGLSVVHGIMVSHDGAITVHSEPRKGTVFHLYFPAHAGEATAAVDEGEPPPRGRGERVLFVDDEDLLARLGQKTLVALGYQVEVATQPAIALAMVRADPQRFALVMTDLTMPGMTGLQLADHLLQIQPSLPIILMTGYSPSLTSEGAEAAGIRRVLFKPTTIHSLGTAVHATLSDNFPALKPWPGSS